MKKNKIKKNKGSVLVYALLLMMLILAIGLDIMSSSISNQKNSIVNTNTNRAFSTAEEGVGLFFISVNNRLKLSGTTLRNIYPTCVTNNMPIKGVSGGWPIDLCYYKISFYDVDGGLIEDCDTPVVDIKRIESMGYYKNTVRVVSVPVTFFFDEGLIAHWKLDEAPGAISAVDSTGNGNLGSPSSSDISFNDGYADISDGGYIRVGGLLSDPEPEAVTLSAWVKLDKTGNLGSEIISLGNSVAIRIKKSATKVHAFYWNGASWEDAGNSGHINLLGGDWHYIAVTIDPQNSEEKFYYDGEPKNKDTNGGSIDYGLGSDTYLGIHGDGDVNFNFDGKMREVRVYDRALSDVEVKALYNATK